MAVLGGGNGGRGDKRREKIAVTMRWRGRQWSFKLINYFISV